MKEIKIKLSQQKMRSSDRKMYNSICSYVIHIRSVTFSCRIVIIVFFSYIDPNWTGKKNSFFSLKEHATIVLKMR